MEYRTVYVIRHVMRDDRLADVHIDADDGVLVFEFRAWRIHPAIVRILTDLSNSVTSSGLLELDLSPDRPPGITAWFESSDNLAIPMALRIPPADGMPLAFEMKVMREMIDPALMREANEYVFPYVCSLLIPTMTAIS